MIALLGMAWDRGAMAACSSPSGNMGQIIYNADYGQMQYCNGTNWMGMGSVPCSTGGLIGYWKLDEGSGTTAADSWGVNTGTLVNGPTWVDGKSGKALNFDGNNDNVNAGSAAALDNLAALSACAWIYPTSASSSVTNIFDKGSSESGAGVGWNFYMLNNYRFGFYSDKNYYKNVNTNVISLNSWQHVCATWDGTTSASGIKLYYNGALQSTVATGGSASTLDDSSADLRIGNDTLNEAGFIGRIDDARLYKRVLTATEISALYNSGSGCF